MTTAIALTDVEMQELEQINLKKIKSCFVLIESESLTKSMLGAKYLAGKIYSSKESWRDYKEYGARNGKWKADDAEETIKFLGVVRPIEQHVIVLKDLDYFERGFFDKVLKKLEDNSTNLTLIGIISDSSLIPKTILSRCLHVYKIDTSSNQSIAGDNQEINNLLLESSLSKDFYSALDHFIEKKTVSSTAELVNIFEKIKKVIGTDSQSSKVINKLLEHLKVVAHIKVLKSKLKITEKEQLMLEVTEAIAASKSGVPLNYVIYRVREILS